MNSLLIQTKQFYDAQYAAKTYAPAETCEEHPFFAPLQDFLCRFQLHNKRCLEIGCGRGAFQDVVEDYTGVDISEAVRHYFHKPFLQASATRLPFTDETFDAIWSYAVLEHVHGLEKALEEMRRVSRPGGLLLLAPAWQCRSWAAEGYAVRPFGDFRFKGRLIKSSIPIRDSVLFRSLYVMPMRALRCGQFLLRRQPSRLRVRTLKPNYEKYWTADSDAVNSVDPFEAILWFASRGDECLSHRFWVSRFLVRTGALILRVRK